MVKREVVDTIREDDAESTETWVDRHTVNLSLIHISEPTRH